MTDIVCQDERQNLQIIDKKNIFQMLKYAILVSDWSISRKSSPLKSLGQMNRNLVGSIL
jgi:hypothetical protein